MRQRYSTWKFRDYYEKVPQATSKDWTIVLLAAVVFIWLITH